MHRLPWTPTLWLLVVLLVAQACVRGQATPEVLWLPTLPPAPTPTPGVHLPPLPPTLRETALVFDDFSEPETGRWPRLSGPWGAMGYAEGGYRIAVALPQTDVWAVLPGFRARDVVVQVDAIPLSGSEYNTFGVLCRYQDDANFYFFVISSAGYYAIVRKSRGEQVQLTPERQFARRDVIRGGSHPNRVRAVCQGDALSLYVNGVLLAQVQEPADPLPEGQVGLLAGAFTEAGVVVHFDNFVVLDPSQTEVQEGDDAGFGVGGFGAGPSPRPDTGSLGPVAPGR